MNILLLEQSPSPLGPALQNENDRIHMLSDPISPEVLRSRRIEFIISYGYRHILRKPVLELLPGRIINLHISYLPWNRGADPNLWSFLQDTPKGVSIHYVDTGVDTGDIIVQREVFFCEEGETLRTTYNKLQSEILTLFSESWPLIRSGGCNRIRQGTESGSFHRKSDKAPFEHLLIKGWDTPVSVLQGKALEMS